MFGPQVLQNERVNKKILIFAFWAALQVDAQIGPISLDQAIQEALEHNLDLAATRLNIAVVETRAITARLKPNPVFSASGQTLNILGADYSPNTPLGPNQLNLHTDFPIERTSKREGRIGLAEEDRKKVTLQVRETMRLVIAQVQDSYVDVQRAKEVLKLAQENLARLEDVVRINEARLRSGDLSQVELDRSRVAALQYRTAVQQAQLELDQAKTQLQQWMGRKVTDPSFDVAGDMRRETVSATPADILKAALERRPDYLGQIQDQARARADLKLQVANSKPDVTVGTEFTRQRAWGIAGNSVGLYFNVPLPIHNRNQGEIARSQRQIDVERAQTVALERSIQTDVEKAYRQYQVSKQLLEGVESDILARALSVRNTTEYSYRRGEASLVEFLDAQRAFNDAMQTFNEARSNYARSLYRIDTVSGATLVGK